MSANDYRTEDSDLRLTTSPKRTLNRVSFAGSRSVSEFVIDSALARAEETLSMRRQFGLDAQMWDAFMAAACRTFLISAPEVLLAQVYNRCAVGRVHLPIGLVAEGHVFDRDGAIPLKPGNLLSHR